MYSKENMILCGSEDNTKVYMEYGAYLKILRYAKAGSVDGSRGVLLGLEDDEGIRIHVALEALYTGDEGLEAPSFTNQSWDRIRSESDEYYPEYKILGQYSTHASAEYNEMDIAMQQSFFSGGRTILFIFNPVDNNEAVYIYEKDFIKLKGMYLFDKYGNEIDLKIKESITRPVSREIELRTKILDKINKKVATQNKIYTVAFIVLVVVIVYLMVQNMELYNNFRDADKNIKTIQSQLNLHEQQIKDAITPTPTPTPKPARRTN